MAYAAAELTWILYLLQEIGFSYTKPIKLYFDNTNALHLTINPVLS